MPDISWVNTIPRAGEVETDPEIVTLCLCFPHPKPLSTQEALGVEVTLQMI